MSLGQLPGSSAQGAVARMRLAVCAALEDAEIQWCLLCGYSTYPEDVDPDHIDLIVPPSQFQAVPRVLAAVPNVRLVQARQHEATSVRYELLTYTPEDDFVLLGIDVSSEIRDVGAVLMSAGEFLRGKRRFRDVFWVPEPALEFVFYLIKNLGKSRVYSREALGPEHERVLNRLYREDPAGAARQLARFFPPADVRALLAAANTEDWTNVRQDAERLRRVPARYLARRSAAAVLRYWIGDFHWRARRLLAPAGLMVAFFGFEGSGKSTVIERLKQDLWQVFGARERYHVRPSVLRPSAPWHGFDPTKAQGEPRLEPAWGLAGSLAKLALWWTDYAIGYCVAVLPCLVRTGLVLFERYSADIVLDPARYQYGGPMWVAHLLQRGILQPTLVFFLDVPPQVLHVRCRHSPYGTPELRDRYLRMVRGIPGGRVIEAAQPLHEVVANVERLIFEHMAARMARRLRLKMTA